MKICDVCHKQTTDRLEAGPTELPQIESCPDCFHDLFKRFSNVEKQLAEMRKQMRLEAVAAWQRERKPAA
jgi:hypothetical protein